ncbi:short-chain collagen C4 [Strongylocentrotus purpuratus]|uniref:Short-chain collagen C4 n=1 Tax=Strongylocentrotus purpuratus TaxID=7668 RepID=A0A7M7G009_STRPU|nr:short-chain collagen C4 [Strongylocentrotus purpuratus]
MKSFFVITLVLFSCLCLVGVTQAVAVSKEGTQDEAFDPEHILDSGELLTQTEEDKISEIRKQVLFLQESVAEITRSFSTLELVARNPSMMAKIHIPDSVETDLELGEPEKTRRRRELDSQSTFPTSFPPSGAEQQSLGQNPFGPYSWPMYSGQCFLCPAGVPGQRGPLGPQGTAGRDGRDGRDAPTGPQAQEAPTSPSDETNPTESRGDAVVRPVGNMTSLPGVIYIRWGNDVCPEDAELIYSGTIGGAYYSHTGSGSNHLCMPEEPIYDEVETSLHVERARLYSSEYQVNTGPSRIQPMHDHTPTCAVCRAPSGRTSKLMIPARNVCPSQEWRLEYAGYLMAEKYTHKRSEFVCVDREMVPKAGTLGDQNGALLYMTEVRCLAGGGLDCGPYIDGYEITCAVCTI